MHVCCGIGMDFIRAGITEVRIAGRIIDDDINVRVLKRIDDVFRFRIFLQIDRIYRKRFKIPVAFKADERNKFLGGFLNDISLFIRFFRNLLK